MDAIPYARQEITDDDVAAVIAALRSGWITQGPAIARFEQSVAGQCGARHAVAVNSGTAGLHLAMLALGLGPGKRLWTSPNTFVASANCGLYCGAEIDFVDVDPADATLSAAALAAKLEAAEKAGTLPDVVVPVHYAGQPCDMAKIEALAERYGFALVVDACHAVGGSDRGHPIGGPHGRAAMTVFSFHPVKLVTAGEGGAVTTEDDGLRSRLECLRSHGITRDFAALGAEPDGPWDYRQTDLGFNYRITDLQAALGASQMARLEAYLRRREELAERYDRALAGLPLRPLARNHRPGDRSGLHLYVIRLLPEAPLTRRQLFEALRERGIIPQVHYIPVHTQPFYRARGFAPGDFPEAERHYAEALSLPLFPTLRDEEQERVVAALHELLG